MTGEPARVRCPQCGALVPDVDGPTHKYVPSAPGCWALLGEVQADEMQRFGYPPAHRLVVDAYMAQHPGDGTDRRDRQSVFVHLVALCAVLEAGMGSERVWRLMDRLTREQKDFPVLAARADPGPLTVTHMAGAGDLADYEERAREWAGAVWASWEPSHALIREALAPLAAG